MKKSLFIALVGIVLFALTSCGGGTKGTKEFNDAKAFIEKYDKQITNAKTCDEIESIIEKMEEDSETLGNVTYAETEQVTPDEEEVLEELVTNLTKNMMSKTLELGCFE